MMLGLLCLLIIVYLVMAVGAKRQARVIIAERLRDLSMDVTEWRENYKTLRKNTDSDSLAKARMLARIIQYDPEILKNDARLKELASVLNETAVPNRLIAVPFGNHMLEMAEGGMLCNAYLETTLRWFEEYR